MKTPQNGRREAGGPLYSESAQRAVLGSCLLKNDLLRGPMAPLSIGDFVGSDHQRIFGAICRLAEDERPFDEGSVIAELSRTCDDAHWYRTVGSLIDGAVPDVGIVARHVQTIREFAIARSIHSHAESLQRDVEAGVKPDELLARNAEFSAGVTRIHHQSIQGFVQIPDIMTMDLPPIKFLVDGMIARKTITLWAGIDGTAKTFLSQRMAFEVATGGKFLGKECRKSPVLYLDYENPSFAVRERLNAMTSEPIDGLKVWGTWLKQQPPQIGSDLLLGIAKEVQPLIFVDPFRYAHGAEENDSTEMMAIMQHLRYYAAAGGAVVILHHPAKTEGSTGRGSSAIRGAADVAFLQEMDDESGLITLKCVKNRFGGRYSVTIRPDYDAGDFEVADSPEFAKRISEIEKLEQFIREKPGRTQNELCAFSGMTKKRAIELLKSQTGCKWDVKPGPNKSLHYYPLGWFPSVETTARTTKPPGQNDAVVSWFSPLKGETTEPPSALETGWMETIL